MNYHVRMVYTLRGLKEEMLKFEKGTDNFQQGFVIVALVIATVLPTSVI